MAVPCLSYAEGPLYKSKDVIAQQEFDNIYQDLRNLRVSTVTVQPGSTNYIQNSNTLQSNATFYVSSGTVTNFNSTTIKTPIITSTSSINLNASGQSVQIIVSTNGAVTQPTQPSFLVVDGTGASNVTGDGTVYTELWPTEIFDQASNFASNTFTAPVTGRYDFTWAVTLVQLAAAHTTRLVQLVTSNRNYQVRNDATTTGTFIGFNGAVIADVDANDTVTIQIDVAGSTKVVDVTAATDHCYFSGSLTN